MIEVIVSITAHIKKILSLREREREREFKSDNNNKPIMRSYDDDIHVSVCV